MMTPIKRNVSFRLLLSSSQLQPYAECNKLTANAPYHFCLPAHQSLLARLMFIYCIGKKHSLDSRVLYRKLPM